MVSDCNGMKASSGGGRHLETLRGRAGGGSGRSGRSAGSGVGGVGAVAFRIQFRVKRGETRFQFIEIERPSTTSEKIAHRGLAPPLGSSFEVEFVLTEKLGNGDIFDERSGTSSKAGDGVTNRHANRFMTDDVEVILRFFRSSFHFLMAGFILVGLFRHK